MKRLDRIKVRLLKLLNVSQEDWWDDLRDKYLGDKFRDSGPTDIAEDFEVVEELQIDQGKWANMLYRTDEDMFVYRNVMGNSGVAMYEGGGDWFLIKFKDGSLYLYTTKSTTQANIDRMAQLAYEGSGLNRFVNLHVGRHYAGRNYKGALTMMPGMESINNPLAYRALQLIIAFENTLMEQTISQEGIGDLFTKLKHYVQGRDEHGVKGEDDKPGVKVNSGDKWWSKEYDEEIKNIRDAIKRFYLNPNWLDKQKFVSGPVDPKGIAEPLNFNGSLGNDPLGNVEKGVNYVITKEKQWIPIVMEYDKKLQAIDKRVKQETIGSGVVDEKGEALVEKAIKEMHSLPKPKYKPDGTCGLGNIGLVIKDDSIAGKVLKPYDVPKSLPALTKEQVIKASQLILKVLDFDNVHGRMKTPSWLDHSDGHKFNSWLNDNYESTYFEYYDMDHHALDDLYIDGLYDLFDQPNTLTALEKWIDRSIVGKGKTSSNEEYQMSVTLERFNEINETSGKDGLEPVAQKAMNIAMELMGEDPVVSNEGVWGAIKYLFGGNYENLPKINTAYDEAVDAVNATYGNPDWVKKRRLKTGQVKMKAFSKIGELGPAKVLADVKKNNNAVLDKTVAFFKEEIEYLSKYTKALATGDKEKISALLHMFEDTPRGNVEEADTMDLGKAGAVPALDGSGIINASKVFDEAVKYRLATDVFFSSGYAKIVLTESGKERYGRDGTETARHQGDAQDLCLRIGDRINKVEDIFYSATMPAWDNVNGVVKGTLMLMEASAG